MGLLGLAIGGICAAGAFALGRSSGGRGRSTSNTNTVYEPDKVEIAKIEAESKENLARMDNERVELIKQAKIEQLECETRCKMALEAARLKGLEYEAELITNLQNKLNDITKQRLEIIEHASIGVVKQIEEFYSELSRQVENDNYEYTSKKYPLLLDTLSKYEEGSAAHTAYLDQIKADAEIQNKHYWAQLDSVLKRQETVIDTFVKNKDGILEQTNKLTAGILDVMHERRMELNGVTSVAELEDGNQKG